MEAETKIQLEKKCAPLVSQESCFEFHTLSKHNQQSRKNLFPIV